MGVVFEWRTFYSSYEIFRLNGLRASLEEKVVWPAKVVVFLWALWTNEQQSDPDVGKKLEEFLAISLELLDQF